MDMDHNGNTDGEPRKRKRRRNRWGDAPPETKKEAPKPKDARASVLALQASVKARLEALKKAKRPAEAASLPPPPAAKKAKVYELDLNSIPGPPKVVKTTPIVQKPKVNPYLAHREKSQLQDETKAETQDVVEDSRLERVSKPRQRNRAMHFVEPGTFVALAERKRKKAANALESGFVSGRKTGNFVQSTGIADVYGGGGGVTEKEEATAERADCGPPEKMPLVMEWWDMELLPSKLKKQVAAQESKALSMQTKARLQKIGRLKGDDSGLEAMHESVEVIELRESCFRQAKLTYSKTSALVQHLVPVRAHPEEAPREATLYLTKRELKRQRKLRRAEKQREQQDMQAAGLIPPPEPKLTLQNFIKVLGDQAYLDPTQMEQKVMEQVEARKRAHMERNAANKLTKGQRSAKRARKLAEDTSKGVSVAIFYVKDMSHPYHRAKVDLNAQQYNITGGVLECMNPPLACVICEGGPKAIKRYTRLMLVRMKWTGNDDDMDEEDDEEDGNDGQETKPKAKFNPENKCSLVWTGMNVKRLFKGFIFQACETSEIVRKVLANKGVGHYWDQVLSHSSGQNEGFNFKLAGNDDDEVDDFGEHDVPMKEA